MRLLTRPAWLHDDRAFSPEAGEGEHLAGGELVEVAVVAGDVVGGFVVGVAAGLADEQGRQAEPEPGEGDAEVERLGSQPGVAAM